MIEYDGWKPTIESTVADMRTIADARNDTVHDCFNGIDIYVCPRQNPVEVVKDYRRKSLAEYQQSQRDAEIAQELKAYAWVKLDRAVKTLYYELRGRPAREMTRLFSSSREALEALEVVKP